MSMKASRIVLDGGHLKIYPQNDFHAKKLSPAEVTAFIGEKMGELFQISPIVEIVGQHPGMNANDVAQIAETIF